MDPATKPCPFCAETVLAAAVKCKHCGSMLDKIPGAEGATRREQPAAVYLANPNRKVNAQLGIYIGGGIVVALFLLIFLSQFFG